MSQPEIITTESLEAAILPVLDWYQSDEHEKRPLLEIVADIVADLRSDRQDLIGLRSAVTAACTRFGPQLTLGQLIKKLNRFNRDLAVAFDFCSAIPTCLRSYRGFYEHLALDYSMPGDGDINYGKTTVGDLIDHCEQALGATYIGYKGGNYLAGPDTPLWVAGWGKVTSTAVVGVADHGWVVVLETQRMRD